MGIQGLLPALKPIQKTRHLSEFSGKTLAVDAYVWLHKGVYSCATELATGKGTTKYVDYAMHRVRLLRHHKIEPYIVFDGGPLPAKKGTESERKQKREENLARGKALTAQGKHSQARECYLKCVDVTPQMAYQFIKALRVEAVQYVVAPYEADAQLAYLERVGLVDGIVTEDSDLLVFGCQTVLFKLDSVEATAVCISRKDFGAVTTSSSDISLAGWSDVQFRAMAILSGCDYLPSISGIGLKTACTLLRKWKTAEQTIRAVTLEGKKAVPQGYLRQFRLAEKCFQHQRVYCPLEEKLVHLSPISDDWTDEFDEYCGGDLEPTLAKKLAIGDVDPVTLLPMADINPTFKPRSLKSTAATNLKADKKGKGKETKPTPSGGILSFFGPNPIIPPRTRAPPLISKQPAPISAGKASGKRTLVGVMDQDMARKKQKHRQSTPGNFTTQSKFFTAGETVERSRSSSILRRHSAGSAVLAGPSRQQEAEKENTVPDYVEQQEEDQEELDGSDLSMCAQAYADSEVDLDLDQDAPPNVEQEDGYVSPMAPSSPSHDAQDLSSPVRPSKLTPLRNRAQHPSSTAVQNMGNDDVDFIELVSSPPSGGRHHPYPYRRSCSPRRFVSVDDFDSFPTPMTAAKSQQRSAPAGPGKVLVQDTPTPAARTLSRTNSTLPALPVRYNGPDLRSTLGVGSESDLSAGSRAKDGELEEADGSGSASPPSPSPDTPVNAPASPSQRQEGQDVIDVDELDLAYAEDEMRIAAEARTKAVMLGWRQRWAHTAHSTATIKPDNQERTSKGKAKEKAKASSSVGRLKRSNTNVTPAGRHSLGKSLSHSSSLHGKKRTVNLKSPHSARGKAGMMAGSLNFFQPVKIGRDNQSPIVLDGESDDDDDIVVASSPICARAHAALDLVEVESVVIKTQARLSQFRYK